MQGDEMFRAAPDQQSLASRPIVRSGKKYGLDIPWVCFDAAPVFVRTHFHHRTEPCTKPLGHHCVGCAAGTASREMAYIGGAHGRTKMRGVLEMTALAANQLKDTTDDLRGRIINVSRAHNVSTGQMLIELSDQSIDRDRLPASWDTRATLLAIWRVDVHLHLPAPPDLDLDSFTRQTNGNGVHS